MLVAAAFVPCPPVLHPAVSGAAAGELADLRDAAIAAVRAAANDTGADTVVVVGPDTRTGPHPQGSRGTLRPFGVDVDLGAGDAPVVLPPSLGLGAWLCAEAGVAGPVHFFGVTAEDEPSRCAAVGAALADRGTHVALVVMGDGSARRDVKAPGSLDERAEPFDRAVESALGRVDLEALAALDATLSAELMATGRAPWQVAAGAADAGAARSGTVLHASAPYGVGYVVATWLPE